MHKVIVIPNLESIKTFSGFQHNQYENEIISFTSLDDVARRFEIEFKNPLNDIGLIVTYNGLDCEILQIK